MAIKKLNPAIRYKLPVVEVSAPKGFMGKSNTPLYAFKVTFRDKVGFEYLGEYVIQTPNQDIFLPGSIVVFRIIEVQQYGTIIGPIMDSFQEGEFELVPEFLKPAAGESYAIALDKSVQLLAAEKSGMLEKIEDADIQRMLGWADEIDQWMILKQTQRIVSN